MELEFFCKPGTNLEWFAYWKKFCLDFLIEMGLDEKRIRFRDHSKEELAFYSNATTDIEFLFFFGWGELWGIADRTDYDLRIHQEHSKESLEYFDPDTNTKYIPHVVEPSVGVERLFLAVLTSAFDEEVLEDGETRQILHLHPALAPFKAAVFPLTNKLIDDAEKVYDMLRPHFMCDFDTRGKIGKRYRRHDAIGTPFCITFDFDSLEDQSVTIRDRDTMAQERVKISDIVDYINKRIM
jgi:glycyl-tRNA synthetase